MQRNCPFCGSSVVNCDAKVTTLTAKGVEGIKNAAAQRGATINVQPRDEVHYQCRSNFCNKKLIDQDRRKRMAEDSQSFASPMKRRSIEQFLFTRDCCFCGRVIQEMDFELRVAFPVKTFAFQEAILKVCDERKDRWSISVAGRIASAGDLHAAEAVYHQTCSVNFRTGKLMPTKYSNHPAGPVKRGRPKDDRADNALEVVIQEICADDEVQWTIPEVQARMSELCETPYGAQYIKDQLRKKLGDSVTISHVQGRANVITFNTTVAQILQEFHDTPACVDEEAEKLRILSAAAAIIRSETISKCETTYEKEYYPEPADLQSIDKMLDFVPNSIRLLLGELISSKNKALKMASLGQCLVQAIRPRSVLAPLQLGLAVQFHHYSGAKFLIDTLFSHGYSSSYDEVLRFESCSATQVPVTSDIRNEGNVGSVLDGNGHFRQFVCDNADRNPWTLDGKKALHAMGMIETITPAIEQKVRIKRESAVGRRDDSSPIVPIHYYDRKNNDPTMYDKLRQARREVPVSLLDFLWTLSWPLKLERIGWTGFMHAAEKGDHAGKATVRFLPMIDMDPTNMSCIYSTLLFLSAECSRHNCTPIVTFDSPLYWKARTVISNETNGSPLKRTVLDLGGFHTMLSFLGSIGHVMHNSGLSEIMSTVIGENAVKLILSGKAYSRAVRAHFMITSALNATILHQTYDIPLLVDDESQWEPPPDLRDVEKCYDSVLNGEELTSIQECTLRRIYSEIQDTEERLKKNSTSALFIEYMRMVILLRDFIRAQRASNWNLHKSCLKEMLPYFAATGHNQYTKCVHVYLQDMEELESSNPEVYNKLESGLFVVRRTDRFWAGLSKDLVIEQTLMRTMKSTGGLTHGRGVMEEKTRTRWLMSLPACSAINEALQLLTGRVIASSEQHIAKDSAPARVKRDNNDTIAILQFLIEYNPFSDNDASNLRNIVTGLTSNVANPHKVRTVGEAILEQMSGKKVKEYSFTRKSQIVQIGVEKQIKIDGEPVPIDSDLLLHRLLSAEQQSEEEAAENLFKYELSAYPPSLFEENGKMRSAAKSELAEAIAALPQCPVLIDPKKTLTVDINVIDGGSLLHKVAWEKGSTYSNICSSYIKVLRKKENPTVVFDGYNGPSTKDMTHQNRSKISGPKIQVADNRVFKTTKSIFLSNESNKSDFISLLMAHIQSEDRMKCEQAPADADVMIAMKGVQMAGVGPTCVVAEDTDVLVLLIYHASRASIPSGQLYLKSDLQNCKRVWDIGAVCEAFGKQLCRLLPFAHAFCGCDTTSRLFGIGKSQSLKKLQQPDFKAHAEVFSSDIVPEQSTIVEAGEKALISLYGGTEKDDLERLRQAKFREKAAKSISASVKIRSLPPTPNAAMYHSFRVFLQVRVWMGEDDVDPLEWGWQLKDGRLWPRTTDRPPAPDRLLKVVRCQCKSDCSSKRCSCRRQGFECNDACTNCRGGGCENQTLLQLEDERDC